MDAFESEREKLRAIKSQFEEAVATNNMEVMREHAHTAFSFVSFTDRAFNDFDSFIARWQQTREEIVGQGNFSTTLLPEPTIFVGDIAIAYGNSDNRMHDRKGHHYQYPSHWTVVFQKDGEDWKVLRAHNSLDPFGNPMLRAGIKKAVLKYTALGFIAGIVVSALALLLILR